MFYKVCSELTPPRYDYRGSGSKLNLRKEERMTLLRRATTDWYEVEKQNGERGLVPSNYLEEVSLDAGVQEVYYRVLYALAARGNQLALRAGELLVLRKKLSADWVHHNLDRAVNDTRWLGRSQRASLLGDALGGSGL